jgi:hypothetical protein
MYEVKPDFDNAFYIFVCIIVLLLIFENIFKLWCIMTKFKYCQIFLQPPLKNAMHAMSTLDWQNFWVQKMSHFKTVLVNHTEKHCFHKHMKKKKHFQRFCWQNGVSDTRYIQKSIKLDVIIKVIVFCDTLIILHSFELWYFSYLIYLDFTRASLK